MIADGELRVSSYKARQAIGMLEIDIVIRGCSQQNTAIWD